MAQTASWWMYVLNAFTPMMTLFMLLQFKLIQQQALQAKPDNAPASLPPFASAIAGLLTQVLMAAFMYAFWLGAHWLVFWCLNKPLYIDAYFFKPPLVVYWFPYLFGLFFISYSSLIEPKLTSLRIKAVMGSINYLAFAACFYMVFVTYLKWLTT
ncbi:hypothetical protein [Rheinheimera gaetbuli]